MLAVDIGNTAIKIGGFEGETMCFQFSMASDAALTADQYAAQLHNLFDFYGVSGCRAEGAVLSCVVPRLLSPMREAVQSFCTGRVLTVGRGVKTGLNLKIDDPSSLGTDFVCGAVGALARYSPPLVIFDFGTATTVTALDSSGALVGKAILAGVQLSLDALREHAANLPSVEACPPCGLLARSTVDAMLTGAVLGSAAMAEGLLARYRKALGQEAGCIITGGNGALIAPYIQADIHLEPDLVLWGLQRIYRHNCPKS